MNITEGNVLEMNNVLSYRGKVTQQEMSAVMNEMQQIIKNSGAEKNGPAVSATFAVEQPMMDIEVMIPLDRMISVPEKYKMKPVFRLTNAVKIRHTGNPSGLQNSGNEIMKYISERQLMPVTAGYNVTVKEPLNQMDTENMIVDIYVGVCDNIL